MASRLNHILNNQESIIQKYGNSRGGYRRNYTHIEIDAAYKASNGLCAICGKPRGKRNHALDHDHATGKLRGALCTQCNMGIGMFHDYVAVMLKAIEYINKHRME